MMGITNAGTNIKNNNAHEIGMHTAHCIHGIFQIKSFLPASSKIVCLVIQQFGVPEMIGFY